MRIVTTIPWETSRALAIKLAHPLAGDYSHNPVDLVEQRNLQLQRWAAFDQYADSTATIDSRLDRLVFWKMHGLGPQYHRRIPWLLQDYVRAPRAGPAKTWVLTGRPDRGGQGTVAWHLLVAKRTGRFLSRQR